MKLASQLIQKTINLLKKIPLKFWILFFSLSFFLTSVVLALPYIYSLPWFKTNKPNEIKYSISNLELAKKIQPNLDLSSLAGKPFPTENSLVIPKIGVESKILEDSSINILQKEEGVWREPTSGTPASPSNMVIAGHRFQYLPPNTHTFYDLDKLEKDDLILVYWKNQEGKMQDYMYQIEEKKSVQPTEVSVRKFNQDWPGELTLYTCGPDVGQNSQRIVIIAKLVS